VHGLAWLKELEPPPLTNFLRLHFSKYITTEISTKRGLEDFGQSSRMPAMARGPHLLSRANCQTCSFLTKPFNYSQAYACGGSSYKGHFSLIPSAVWGIHVQVNSLAGAQKRSRCSDESTRKNETDYPLQRGVPLERSHSLISAHLHVQLLVQD
jgi:hypothetical protein